MGAYYDKLRALGGEYSNSRCNCNINLNNISNNAVSTDGSTAVAVQIIYVNCCDYEKDKYKEDHWNCAHKKDHWDYNTEQYKE